MERGERPGQDPSTSSAIAEATAGFAEDDAEDAGSRGATGMCLAIPMKVVEIDGSVAQVEEGGVRREARVDLIDGVKLGDYVIVHAGVAIDRLDPEEARETLKLFEQMLKAAE